MNQVVILTPSEFDRFVVEMKDHLSREIQAVKDKVIESPIGIKEAAHYLKMDRATLYRKIKDNDIPASVVHTIAGQKVFFKSELYEFIKKS
jgi:excisionase family DNA binding protein